MDDSDGDPLPALKAARDEARATLDHQVHTSDEIDRKAIKLLQFDATIGTVVATALPVVVGAEILEGSLLSPYTFAGVAALFLSASVAGIVYTMSAQFGGIGAKPLDRAAREEFTEQTFYRRLVLGYADWIRANRRRNAIRAPFVTVTILLTVASLVLIGLGVVRAVVGSVPLALRVAVAVAFVGAVAGSRLHRQVVRLLRCAMGEETVEKHDAGFSGEQISKGHDNRER